MKSEYQAAFSGDSVKNPLTLFIFRPQKVKKRRQLDKLDLFHRLITSISFRNDTNGQT